MILEVPIEQADAALAALGGVPQPASERWVGIALIGEQPDAAGAPKPSEPAGPKFIYRPDERPGLDLTETAKPKRSFSGLSPTVQAGIRCEDSEFMQFLVEQRGCVREDVAGYVRGYCGVTSRADLDKQLIAGKKWRELEAEYQAWRLTQRYADSVR